MTAAEFPQAFIKREQAQLGPQWNDFISAHLEPSPVSIRFNPHKTKDQFDGPRVPWATHGLYLKERPSFTLDPAYHGGKYYVQEASSMFLEQAITQATDSSTLLTVLDLCAAPGGKSTHLLSLLNENSLLVSNEVIQSRAGILAENIQKWGHCNAIVTNNDPSHFQRLPGFFDVIVVDAPCSGEGLFRKDPGASQEWSEEAVALCSRRQRRILNDVWPALKTGGILIYSTCTYNALENEENLKWLNQEYDFESIPLKTEKEWGVDTVEDNSIFGYRFFPHRVKGEGFFLSVMRKVNTQAKAGLNTKGKFFQTPKKFIQQLHGWIVNPERKSFILRDDLIQFFPIDKTPEIELVVKNMHVVVAGTFMATAKHEKLVPHPALALSLETNREMFNCIPVDKEVALQYLRKDALMLSPEKKGFALITFEDIPLGWVNVLDNRMNNLYPSEWRIRMR